VDQLQLGEASGSPDAIKLPVKLGIALLQDRHGVIALDVPVNGRLDDPKFRLGPLIMQVFMNIITKAINETICAARVGLRWRRKTSTTLCLTPGTADFTRWRSSQT